MIFYTYEEKCALQGSAFIELQFCRAPADTDIKELVAVDSIENGRKDSLYVSDAGRFYIEYGKYFDCGIYNSLKQGAVDIYGMRFLCAVSDKYRYRRYTHRQPFGLREDFAPA